ncbi:MAG: SUF system NifU family Fe-S cluster assembly protein [Zetaproteobacteria bacterium CG2_30_46_52]|nr:MAG: SUF system NifU family Fe-S cluster assembly protein [Zetaproteobacteria bacterium CG2_30_46_52]
MFSLGDLYQQVIIDHTKSPRNFGKLDPCNHDAEGYNPLCGDQLHIYLQINADNIIEAIKFEGQGCSISTASASLMTEALKGKPVAEFERLFAAFHHMATADMEEAPDEDALGKLAVLSGVKEFPSRIKCATLCWHTLKAAIEDKAEPVRTE